MKVLLCDFCDTLVNFQTADVYVKFAQEYLGLRGIKHTYMNLTPISRLTERVGVKKKAILYQLKGIDKSALQESAYHFYLDRIKPNLYRSVLDFLDTYRKKGYDIYIVSGGYRIYIEYFAVEFNIKGIIANEFEFLNGRFTGKMVGNDCMRDEKVKRIDEVFPKKDEITDSVSVTDCISDLPMLKWANHGVVVSRTVRRKWVSEHKFEHFVLSEH